MQFFGAIFWQLKSVCAIEIACALILGIDLKCDSYAAKAAGMGDYVFE